MIKKKKSSLKQKLSKARCLHGRSRCWAIRNNWDDVRFRNNIVYLKKRKKELFSLSKGKRRALGREWGCCMIENSWHYLLSYGIQAVFFIPPIWIIKYNVHLRLELITCYDFQHLSNSLFSSSPWQRNDTFWLWGGDITITCPGGRSANDVRFCSFIPQKYNKIKQ